MGVAKAIINFRREVQQRGENPAPRNSGEGVWRGGQSGQVWWKSKAHHQKNKKIKGNIVSRCERFFVQQKCCCWDFVDKL